MRPNRTEATRSVWKWIDGSFDRFHHWQGRTEDILVEEENHPDSARERLCSILMDAYDGDPEPSYDISESGIDPAVFRAADYDAIAALLIKLTWTPDKNPVPLILP